MPILMLPLPARPASLKLNICLFDAPTNSDAGGDTQATVARLVEWATSYRFGYRDDSTAMAAGWHRIAGYWPDTTDSDCTQVCIETTDFERMPIIARPARPPEELKHPIFSRHAHMDAQVVHMLAHMNKRICNQTQITWARLQRMRLPPHRPYPRTSMLANTYETWNDALLKTAVVTAKSNERVSVIVVTPLTHCIIATDADVFINVDITVV